MKYVKKKLDNICRQFAASSIILNVAHHHPHVGPDDVLEGRGVIGDPQQCYNGILTSNVDTGRWLSCQIRVKLKVRGIICTRGSMLYKQTGTEVLNWPQTDHTLTPIPILPIDILLLMTLVIGSTKYPVVIIRLNYRGGVSDLLDIVQIEIPPSQYKVSLIAA